MSSLFDPVITAGKRLAFSAARSPYSAFLIHLVVAHMSFAIPSTRLVETDTLVAFYHPAPAYPLHILLLPKRQIASLADLQPADGRFLTDLFTTVKKLVVDLDLEKSGYRLIANGGQYQDVPHLHFHLVSETKIQSP